MNKKAAITGIGHYLPRHVETNDALAVKLQTSDDWITERTGIKQRHIAADGELTSDLAAAAARQALQDAGRDVDDIDLIIVATTTPDHTFPSTASYTQAKLGVRAGVPAFDVQAVCSGFVYALSVGSAMIASGQAQKALVIGAEIMTRILDWEDRTTAVLFGDGAGCVVLEAVDNDDPRGVIDNHIACDGAKADLLYVDGGPALDQRVGFLRMKGREVFRHAVDNISDTVRQLLERNQLSVSDIDWFVPHQANKRIIDAVANRIGLPAAKTVITVDQHANTSAASIPLALSFAVQDGRIKQGDLIMTEAMGGGFTWGGNLFRL
jgi:3-oxoacyl-[acyl-carrier-protein] synthase-3